MCTVIISDKLTFSTLQIFKIGHTGKYCFTKIRCLKCVCMMERNNKISYLVL